MADVVVVGAGIAGLSCALTLARTGHHVLVLEKDAVPVAPGEEPWTRPGAPQTPHGHNFHARGRNLLREHLPHVLHALLGAGARELRLVDRIDASERRDGDEDLVALACRRKVFEGVLRAAAAAEARVQIRPGSAVAGLTRHTSRAEVPRITGVRLRDGGTIAAELTVDASGRLSRAGAWLAELGARRPAEWYENAQTSYYVRHFQLRPGAVFPRGDWLFGPTGDLGYLRFSVLQGDSGTFAVTVNTPAADRELRRLREEAAWMTAAGAMPALAPLLDPALAEPASPVFSMGNLRNVLHQVVADGEPVARGFYMVGDSLSHTNPTQGWGMSVAIEHAVRLAQAVAAFPADPRRQAVSFYGGAEHLARERFQVAAGEDRERRRLRDGGAVDWTRVDSALFCRKVVYPVGSDDAEIFRLAVRRMSLLDPPGTLLANDAVVRRALALYRSRAAEPGTQGPARKALLARLPPAPGGGGAAVPLACADGGEGA